MRHSPAEGISTETYVISILDNPLSCVFSFALALFCFSACFLKICVLFRKQRFANGCFSPFFWRNSCSWADIGIRCSCISLNHNLDLECFAVYVSSTFVAERRRTEKERKHLPLTCSVPHKNPLFHPHRFAWRGWYHRLRRARVVEGSR